MPGTKRAASGESKAKKTKNITGFELFKEKKKSDSKKRLLVRDLQNEYDGLSEEERKGYEDEAVKKNQENTGEGERERRQSTDSGVTEGEISMAPEETANQPSSSSKNAEKIDETPSNKETQGTGMTGEGESSTNNKKGKSQTDKEFGDQEKREKVTRGKKIPVEAAK